MRDPINLIDNRSQFMEKILIDKAYKQKQMPRKYSHFYTLCIKLIINDLFV